MNATSGLSSSTSARRSPSASSERTSWPSRASASAACAPERSDTPRSSDRPPLSTTTRRGSLIERRSRSCVAAPAPGSLLLAPRELDDIGHRLARARLARALVPRARALATRRRARERADQRVLRAHRLADPADALADVLLG